MTSPAVAELTEAHETAYAIVTAVLHGERELASKLSREADLPFVVALHLADLAADGIASYAALLSDATGTSVSANRLWANTAAVGTQVFEEAVAEDGGHP